MADFLTPVGRLVQGDCFEMQTKDQQGALRVVKSGPNAGQPSPQLFIAVAFAKTDPAWPAFRAIIDAEARTAWPQLHPNGGPCVMAKFSNKIIDGDGRDDKGQLWSTREGFAGHWVVRFSSGYPVKVWRQTNPGQTPAMYAEVTDPKECKRGYFVRVGGSVVSNTNAQKPGLYMNLSLIEVAYQGPEIVSGPDAGTVLGSAPLAPPPPGASALGGPPAALPGATTPPAPPAAPPYDGYMAAPPAAPPAPPAAPPAPPAAPPPPPPAPVRQMLPAANGATYESMLAAGWTDATLVQHGMMAA